MTMDKTAKALQINKELVEALELALPIIVNERAVMVDGYTNLSGPDVGKVTDADAVAIISSMDVALSAMRNALTKAKDMNNG